MGRKKKEVVESIAQIPEVKKEKTYLFQIVALSDNVKLYKYPETKNAQGRLKKGQLYNVICEINYTPVKMYKLSTGYYIIADHNIQKR